MLDVPTPDRATTVTIDQLRADDVSQVARLHLDLFGEGEMHGHSAAKMGHAFLEHIYYRLNLDNPYFFCNVARYDGEVIGFSVFTTDQQNVFGYTVRHHFLRTAWTTLRLLVKKPAILGTLLSNLRYLGGEPTPWVQSVPGWWIVAGVRPEYRTKSFKQLTGVHVASELFDRMEAVMQQHGCPSWYGVVHPENAAINTFLQRRGASEVGTAHAQGMEMRYYVKTFDPGEV